MSGAPGRLAGAAVLAAVLASSSLPAGPQTDLVKWRSIAAGEAEAKKTGKPALYFFTAGWCGPCHSLEQEVFSKKDVAAQIAKDFVPIVVRDQMRETGRNTPEMEKLADRYGLRGFPTLIVSRPGTNRGVAMEGWDGPQAAVAFLKGARQKLEAAEKKRV